MFEKKKEEKAFILSLPMGQSSSTTTCPGVAASTGAGANTSSFLPGN
jgi:hypothetical protein